MCVCVRAYLIDIWPVSYSVEFSEKKFIEHKMCVLIFSTTLKHFSFYKEWSEKWSKMYIGLHVKHSLFLSDFNETWIFWTDFRKITEIKSWKIRPVSTELFRAEGRTNGYDEADSRFPQFLLKSLKKIKNNYQLHTVSRMQSVYLNCTRRYVRFFPPSACL